MITLGLTGSIGMGKSTVAAMFAAQGVPVFDADAVVHRLQGPDGELVRLIEEHFPGTTNAQGVDRTTLAEAVLGDSDALRRLESLVHPAVARERQAFLERNSQAALVVLDIPLLLETGNLDGIDKIAVVSAPAEIQRRRVLARPGMTEERFAAILKRQMTDEDKRARADYVIPTGGSLEETNAVVRSLIACLAPAGDS